MRLPEKLLERRGSMGAPKKYTPEKLDRAVKRYFKSISREITVTERKPTGDKDDMAT